MNVKSIHLFFVIAMISCSERRQVIINGQEGKTLPVFNILLMDSITTINPGNSSIGKPMVIFYLNPFCPYCRAQTEDIIENIRKEKNTTYYLVSNFSFTSIKNYYTSFALSKFPNIVVGQDYRNFFAKYYNIPWVPYTLIFDKDKKLKKALLGKVSAKTIDDIIQE